MIKRDLGAGFLEDGLAAAAGVGVFLAAALTGKTPPERLLEEFDIVVQARNRQGRDNSCSCPETGGEIHRR